MPADFALHRRDLLRASLAVTAGAVCSQFTSSRLAAGQEPAPQKSARQVRTVLGKIAPEKLGVTLTHEHAPLVDWSELYERPPGNIEPVRSEMIQTASRLLSEFNAALAEPAARDLGLTGPGAIVECTPIRVGRYPALLTELARACKVHIVACTGFWCEAMAPQHPWALQLCAQRDGVKKIAELYIREINQGMEDPSGEWGQNFTQVPCGIIKCATSKYLRPSERRCHEAAAIASRETGCPITTHTTDGGGLEQAQLFLKHRVPADRIVIGHQGNMDDRQEEDAPGFHRQICELGCYIQFDRVGGEKYSVEKTAAQLKRLIDGGHVRQILLSHDHVPYFYKPHAPGIAEEGWKVAAPDFTIVVRQLAAALTKEGVSPADLRTILVENPARMLAF